MNPSVSDETLQAFVDGELDAPESAKLIAQMRDEPTLAQRVCELRELKSMVRVAYARPPQGSGRVGQAPRAERSRLMQRCAYACLFLTLGLGAGWAARGIGGTVQDAGWDGREVVSLAARPDPGKVLLHIDSGMPEKMLDVLDQAERYLDRAEAEGRAMHLEVVANSRGLNLLRAGYSPYAERIAQMRQRHANLHFIACSQSVARFASEGEEVVLLPAARTAPTAIGQIVGRLQQGWTYVRM